MARFDPEPEKQRLAAFYSGQLDWELEEVAAQAYELTGPAREALKAEIARRGLDIELAQAPPASTQELPVKPGDPLPPGPPADPAPSNGESELPNLMTIRKFRDLPEA